MDNGARNWMFSYARRNHWRVASWIEFDDLVQEGYAAYYETLKRYPTAKEPKHIMSLFALVFRSRIEMMVRAKRKQVDDPFPTANVDYEQSETSMDNLFVNSHVSSSLYNSSELDHFNFCMLLDKAPKVIKDALLLFTTEAGRQELSKPYEIREDGSRETTNDRWCKLLGKDPDTTDIDSSLRMYFQM